MFYVFFVVLVMRPKSYIEMTDCCEFSGKPSKWRWEQGLLRKIPEFFSVDTARSKKQHFSRFYGTLRLSCTQPTGNIFTLNQWYWWKADTLKVCLLLVCRVCGQAFGRCRPLKGAEKWSRDHHENWKFTYHRENKKLSWCWQQARRV